MYSIMIKIPEDLFMIVFTLLFCSVKIYSITFPHKISIFPFVISSSTFFIPRQSLKYDWPMN